MSTCVTPPWLSVVMPTYHGVRHLPAALESVRAQKGAEPVEIIAVDDGSTDGTLAVLEEWQTRIPLRIISEPHSGNWVRATNIGLAEARGEWVSFLHQDDTWHANRVAALRTLVERYSSVDVFLHPARFIDEQGRAIGRWRCPLSSDTALPPSVVLPRLAVQNFVPIVSPLFRRAIAKKAGPLDEELWYFADWDYWLRLAAGGTVLYHPEELAAFRVHGDSQTAQRTADWPNVREQFTRVSNRLLSNPAFPESRRASTRRMTVFAREMYGCLLAGMHGRRCAAGALLKAALRIGPVGWWRYGRDARLVDRVLPRLRLRAQSYRRKGKT